VFQLLIYPTIEPDFSRLSYQTNGEGYIITRSFTEWCWDCYAPRAEMRGNPEVSPIHAPDLSGLPPALIVVAEFDPLRDEGESYGEALKAAGVPVEVLSCDGMVHGFYNLLTEQPVAEIREASAKSATALQQAFGMC
jgi:acetyl esterase